MAIYESDRDLRGRVLPFLHDGLAAGESLQVFATPPTVGCLSEALGTAAGRVRWHVPDLGHRRMGPTFGGLREYLARQAHAGERVRLVVEGPPIDVSSRTGAYLRFEAASNEVLGAFGFPWTCLYDRRRCPPAVLDQVGQVHPQLLGPDGDRVRSAHFTAPDAFLRAHPGPLSPVPAVVSLDRWVTAVAEVPLARREAVASGTALGLPAADGEDFELAAAEVLSNAVRHGERPCRIRMWATGSHVVFRVDDQGTGDDLSTKGFRPPDPARGRLGGMGMWLIRQLADVVHVHTGPEGAAVEVQFRR